MKAVLFLTMIFIIHPVFSQKFDRSKARDFSHNFNRENYVVFSDFMGRANKGVIDKEVDEWEPMTIILDNKVVRLKYIANIGSIRVLLDNLKYSTILDIDRVKISPNIQLHRLFVENDTIWFERIPINSNYIQIDNSVKFQLPKYSKKLFYDLVKDFMNIKLYEPYDSNIGVDDSWKDISTGFCFEVIRISDTEYRFVVKEISGVSKEMNGDYNSLNEESFDILIEKNVKGFSDNSSLYIVRGNTRDYFLITFINGKWHYAVSDANWNQYSGFKLYESPELYYDYNGDRLLKNQEEYLLNYSRYIDYHSLLEIPVGYRDINGKRYYLRKIISDVSNVWEKK